MDFLPCVPTNLIPNVVYQFLKGKHPPPIGKRASKAPYPVRKIEASLLLENTSDEVVVPHQDYLEHFIDKDTQVIAVSTMDPFGLGPLTIAKLAEFIEAQVLKLDYFRSIL